MMATSGDKSIFTPNPEKIRIEEFDIYWEKYGNGPQVVLCMVGLLEDITFSLHPVWAKMDSSKFTFIGLDFPGYGNSRPPKRDYFRPNQEFIHDRDARLAKKLMEQLGYQKFSILGCSAGGVVAMHIAAQFPEFVQKVVICNAPFERHNRDIFILRMMSNFDNWPEDHKRYILEKYGKTNAEDIVKSWIKCAENEIITPTEINQWRERVEKHLKAPTLCIVSLRDIVVPAAGARKFTDRMPNMSIYESKHGEHSHLSFLEEFVQVCQEYLLA